MTSVDGADWDPSEAPAPRATTPRQLASARNTRRTPVPLEKPIRVDRSANTWGCPDASGLTLEILFHRRMQNGQGAPFRD